MMGTTKPMKIVEKFFSVPWDNFNFALERLSLILCSMSARDLTDYQMQAAGRVCMTSFTSILYMIVLMVYQLQFILREVLGGPEDLMLRCYKSRGIDYELPFLRPGRGESVIAETESIVNQPKNEDYRTYKKLKEGTAGIFGPTANHEPSEEPTLEHPEIDLRGTMHPISLPVRSTKSHKNLTTEHVDSNSGRQSPYKLR
ncbi:hypothetical protein RvY_04947 [Ramazzottius varieornatus]|uniref:Uncharacterized protein n=1 Tax=Ramazzottius varieornatus TaxID=947166 RepID=A0A1D1UTC3_RAMVA|nr:hypothetical protein RvY_04947 [Ramazzottius varieornatus]